MSVKYGKCISFNSCIVLLCLQCTHNFTFIYFPLHFPCLPFLNMTMYFVALCVGVKLFYNVCFEKCYINTFYHPYSYQVTELMSQEVHKCQRTVFMSISEITSKVTKLFSNKPQPELNETRSSIFIHSNVQKSRVTHYLFIVHFSVSQTFSSPAF